MKVHLHLGFSLLEVLVALLIMGATLLGIISFQRLALEKVYSAGVRNVAMEQAQNLLERFRAALSAENRMREFNLLQSTITHYLPDGRCEYNCPGPDCSVTIFWRDHGLQTLTVRTLIL